LCSDGLWNAFEQNELNALFSNKSILLIGHSLKEYLKKYATDNYMGYLLER